MERNITPLSELPLSNDFMFGEVMRRERICKLFLEALLEKEIDRIEYIDRQKDLSDEYRAHGIRLDIYIKDEAGTRYNVEMQNTGSESLEHRARYYQAGLDRHTLAPNQQYSEMSDTYIIFICTFDYFGFGEAVCKRRCVLEGHPEKEYFDGSHLYFLNSRYEIANTSEPILEFLRKTNDEDFIPTTLLGIETCKAVEDIRTDTSKGDRYMTFAMKMQDQHRAGHKEGWEKGHKEGREEGKLESLAKMMREMYASGMEANMIEGLMKNAGFTQEDVCAARKLV